MLKKLLKYDFGAVLKYWWLAAVTSLGLSVVGGGALRIMNSSSSVEVPAMVAFVIGLAVIFTVISYFVFAILSFILIFLRFHKNFFTDEGYLTFTLPVKRSELLNSKLIMSTVMISLTVIIFMIDVLLLAEIGVEGTLLPVIFKELGKFLAEGFVEEPIWFTLLILESLALLVLTAVFSNLFMFICITFAALVTKKAKVIKAVGVYYGANCVFSGVIQVFMVFGLSGIAQWMSDLPIEAQPLMTILILLIIILFITLINALLYTLEYFMLDRKLNLS